MYAATITIAERINIAITPPMFGGNICHSILHASHTIITTKQKSGPPFIIPLPLLSPPP